VLGLTTTTAGTNEALPRGACDCHLHVYDNSYPSASTATLFPPNASLSDYREIQSRLGTHRAVLVTPSTYGVDNTLLVDALHDLGESGRGVAVISGQESSAHLQQLRARGVRGVRLNFSHGALHRLEEIEPIARLIAPLGWHLQLLMSIEQMRGVMQQLEKLPCALVFDHFARIRPGLLGHPVHTWLLNKLATGKAWVKLSGEYLLTPDGTAGHSGINAIAKSFLQANPGQVLWGSNWPHPTASAGIHPFPNDTALIPRLGEWCGLLPNSEELLQRVLVDNPAQLYGFSS
jgi:D-galactarolactone isomerase